jgi:hypothetical protein
LVVAWVCPWWQRGTALHLCTTWLACATWDFGRAVKASRSVYGEEFHLRSVLNTKDLLIHDDQILSQITEKPL